eukprot:Polyplicarium_translucidae@DN143_c0_g1_i1.p2
MTFEQMSILMVCYDYTLGIITAPEKLKFVLHLHSIIDLITMPVVEFGIILYDQTLAHRVSLYVGWLRFLRLIRIELLLSRALPWLSQIKRRIIALITGAVVLILMFASSMFVLEAPAPDGFSGVAAFAYFAVVTVSTVGYGDFSPTTVLSRLLTMAFILGAFMLLPGQVQRLWQAIYAPAIQLGSAPGKNEDFVLLLGPI